MERIGNAPGIVLAAPQPTGPLTAAEQQEQLRERLMELAPADSEELRAAWQAAAEGVLKEEKPGRAFGSIPEQFLLLGICHEAIIDRFLTPFFTLGRNGRQGEPSLLGFSRAVISVAGAHARKKRGPAATAGKHRSVGWTDRQEEGVREEYQG